MSKTKLVKTIKQLNDSKGSLNNLAGFLDVLIQIDLKHKKTLSEGK